MGITLQLFFFNRANKQYYKEHSLPCKANFIFVIDICQNSINSGFLNSILESLKYSISNIYKNFP